jgi:hypothetical protein
MSYISGIRRTLRALPVFAALALILAAAPAALAAGPKAYLQINDLSGRAQRGVAQLGTAADPAIDGGELPWGGACDGPAVQKYPADSVGALLESFDGAWTIADGPGFDKQLTISGMTYDAASLGFMSEVPGWHLWINNTYYNFGQDMTSALCHALADGDVVVLQATERHFLDGDTMYGVPTTPQLRVELPATVAAGQPVTGTVAAYEPGVGGFTGWGGNALTGTRSAGAGYGLGFDDGNDIFAATDAQGRATLTVPAEASGFVTVIAIAGTDATALPTASHNSAFSVPASVCVYDGQPSSPCTASVSAATPDFGVSQVRETLGAPRAVVVTPALGTAEVTSVKLAGSDVDDFLISSDHCTGAELDSGAATTCTVNVRFAPSVIGAKHATLEVTSTATNGTLSVPLDGVGGSLAAGPAGPAGENGGDGAAGAAGVKGDKGEDGAAGPAGVSGATGAGGPQGVAGATGPQGNAGKNGRDAVCTVRRIKGTPKVTCKLVSSTAGKTSATLTRQGKVYARGTVASLHATRKLGAGAYTLRYRRGRGTAVAVRVRIG